MLHFLYQATLTGSTFFVLKFLAKDLERCKTYCIFAKSKYILYRNMENTKKRTPEEVRTAFKESMRRKKEWLEESNAFLEQIHKQRLAGLI